MSKRKIHRIGIILNGVTGRMGSNQHLKRSILPIIARNGIPLSDEESILPEPVALVGRNEAKLESLARECGIERWTTDLDALLADPAFSIYFDAQLTRLREEAVGKAIESGKHVYCEKPVAEDSAAAYRLYQKAKEAGLRHGVVQDKLWLPGIRKLKFLVDTGFFGEILSIRGEFGYWVFAGDEVPGQRPSWNYRREDGGGIVLDMFPHWHYLLEGLFGSVEKVSCYTATHLRKRWDEKGEPYECTADDAAYATFELSGGVVAHFNSSWAVRVRRDDLLTIQVDGTRGSAMAGLRKCWIQPLQGTPRPVWNPDVEAPLDYFRDWMEAPDQMEYANAFRAQWEEFLKHVVTGSPFPWGLLSGARGVQLAEKALESHQKQSWVQIAPLS